MDVTETSNAAASAAARALVARRWGAAKPVRLARELAERVDELPEIERRSLIAALAEHAERGQSSTA
jgi:hypothetical protein